jgi:hypothetical protein
VWRLTPIFFIFCFRLGGRAIGRPKAIDLFSDPVRSRAKMLVVHSRTHAHVCVNPVELRIRFDMTKGLRIRGRLTLLTD